MTQEQPLPVVARCLKCGREFVTLPAKPRPWRDAYLPLGTRPRDRDTTEVCGGEIVVIGEEQSR